MQLITVAEAARQLAVHEDTIRRMINDGRLPAVRIGTAVRIEEAELERLVQRGRPRRPPPPALVPRLTTGQQRALHARAGAIDKAAELTHGTTKRAALTASSLFFGRELTSWRTINEDEASWTLEWLDEQLERL